jgi:DNA repair exonuclease SbcCD nuclease subunit
MKIALINDTHFGARNDSPIFLEHFLSYFEQQFFPYLKTNNIKTVLHLGDLLDRRKYVNFHTLSSVQSRFIKHIEDLNLDFYCVIGNHDTYFRNTNDINSVTELFGSKMKIISSPTNIETESGVNFAALPWINKSNYQESIDFIKNSNAEYAIGHLEIAGFQVLRGVKHEEGLDVNIFSKFEKVFSGHFHCKQADKNIEYLGTQYQITFNDLNERKGFHVFDTNTRELEFIRSPSKLFHQIGYDDKNYDMSETDFAQYALSFVKVIVQHKTNPIAFDGFIQSLYDAGAYEVSVIEDYSETQTMMSSVDDVSKDTLSLINEEIDSMENIDNKLKLKKMIHDLYVESLTTEE